MEPTTPTSDSDKGKAHGSGENTDLNRRGCGAERQADANFLGLAGHGIRDDSIDTESGEHESECGKDADEEYEEAAR